jgi:hypothetical protein
MSAQAPQRVASLCKSLLSVYMFGWGEISAARVQKLTAAFQQDMLAGNSLDMDMVERFARLGMYGEHSSNIERDLHRQITGIELPNPRMFDLPAKYDGELQRDVASILRKAGP